MEWPPDQSSFFSLFSHYHHNVSLHFPKTEEKMWHDKQTSLVAKENALSASSFNCIIYLGSKTRSSIAQYNRAAWTFFCSKRPIEKKTLQVVDPNTCMKPWSSRAAVDLHFSNYFNSYFLFSLFASIFFLFFFKTQKVYDIASFFIFRFDFVFHLLVFLAKLNWKLFESIDHSK